MNSCEIAHRVPSVEIRDYQIEALDVIDKNEQDGNRTSIIVMAPGLGKTTVMAADTKKFLPGIYKLPGDHIDFGEKVTDGLVREEVGGRLAQ